MKKKSLFARGNLYYKTLVHSTIVIICIYNMKHNKLSHNVIVRSKKFNNIKSRVTFIVRFKTVYIFPFRLVLSQKTQN